MWLVYDAPEGSNKSKENAKRISIVFYDIDHIDPQKFIKKFCEQYANTLSNDPKEQVAKACQNTHIHGLTESLSRHGMHIYAEFDPEMTVDENFDRMEAMLGYKLDSACKNVNRGVFVEPADRWFYYDDQLFEHKVIDVKEPTVNKVTTTKSSPLTDIPIEPQEFMGIPMKDIVEKWWQLKGGDLIDGERHKYFQKFAIAFRYICNDNPLEIFNAAKSYSLFGFAERKLMELCVWACTKPKAEKMNNALSLAIDSLLPQEEDHSEQHPVTGIYDTPLPPVVPEFPPLIKALVSILPPPYKAASAQNCFAALGVLPQQEVKFIYVDNSECTTALMGINIGQTSGGKSSQNLVVNRILELLYAHDKQARKEIEDWKEQCRLTGSNKNKQQKPQVYVQVVNPASTKAALVENLRAANGRFLFSMMDEPEAIMGLNTATSRNEDKLVIKLAFHTQDYGQERFGVDSISALVPMKWNWIMSTTVQKIQKYFANAIADGPLNRISCGYIFQEDFADIPVYGSYKKSANKLIDAQIANLMNAHGLIKSKEATRLAKRMLKESQEISEQCGDKLLFNLSHRACQIAFRKAMILYIANGQKWHKTFDDFILWTLHYDLWIKMHFFGALAKKEMKGETITNSRGPQNLLHLLPKKFTREQLVQLRTELGMNSKIGSLLKVWSHRHYIELQEDGTYINKKYNK